MNELSRDRLWRIGRLPAAAIVGTLTIAVSGPVGQAQTTPEQGTSNSAYTLHVYTDLLQVPTMVLTRLHGNYRALKTQNFMLSIDNGPAFHPVNARVQGDDPITLAILFDFTTDAEGMFTALSEALSGLPHGVLLRRDYISIYAYDCQLQRVTQDKMASADELKVSMQRLMTNGRRDARAGATQSCSTKKRLYDVEARVAKDLAPLPGRRVMLVVSDGEDRESASDWLTVARYIGNQSITIFGLRPLSKGPAFTHGSYGLHNGFLTTEEEDPFGRLCGSTGGLVLEGDSSRKMLVGQVERLVKILRGRYILEFPRPVNGAPGYYALHVGVTDPTAIVRSSGVAFPPRERDAKAKPGTVPQDTSHMPVVGSGNMNASKHKN